MTTPQSGERPEASSESLSAPPRLSRRKLVGALGAAAALRSSASAHSGGKVAAAAGQTAKPRFDKTLVALVNRVTQGFTVEEYQLAVELGYDGYLEHHLDHLAVDDSAVQPFLGGLTTLTQTPKQLQEAAFSDPETPLMTNELKAAAIYRSVNSKRQLFERMVEFWTDHFNIDIHDKSCRFLKHVDDAEVVRANALGSFPTMLDASAHSPAMMFYLDNYANNLGAPQENYGREIMELHTLGVTGGYTEADVKEVARCFTGWGLYSPVSPSFGDFLYQPFNHDTDEKVVLGNVIPAGGQESDALTVLQILSEHPSTAAFVGGKLTKWLLVHQPAQNVLDEVAATYLATGGDIKSMIRVALKKAHLKAAKPWLVENKKLKRPLHFMYSLMRAVDAQITETSVLVAFELDLLGMPPFTFGPPTGYPDEPGAWGSALRPRWSLASRLMSNSIPGITVNEAALAAKLEALGNGPLAERINSLMTGGQMSALDVSRVQQYFDSFGGSLPAGALREGIAFAASSPSFQLY